MLTKQLFSHAATPKHRVTPFNRFIIKLTRTANPVPKEVSYELMDKANSRFRIGLSVTVMVWCFLGSVYSIMKGKEAAAENRDSIYQKNRERHSRAKRADE